MFFAQSDWFALFTFEQNKMASSYVYVTEELFSINEVAVADNTKKATKFGINVFKDIYFFYFLVINALRMCFKMFCLQMMSGRQGDIPKNLW